MQIGFFLVDNHNRMITLSSGALNFTRHDKKYVKWYSGGNLERNDLIIFIGSGFEDVCPDRNILGEKIKELSDNNLIIYRYGNQECFPFIKPIDKEDFEKGNCFADLIYSGEKIIVMFKSNVVDISINNQHCTMNIGPDEPNLLILKDRNGIRYFTRPLSDLNDMKAVLEGHEYAPYIDQEEFPIDLKDFFDGNVVKSIDDLKAVGAAAYTNLNGRAAVIRKLEEGQLKRMPHCFPLEMKTDIWNALE